MTMTWKSIHGALGGGKRAWAVDERGVSKHGDTSHLDKSCYLLKDFFQSSPIPFD